MQRHFVEEAERAGYSGVLGTENHHSPLLPLAAVVHQNQRIRVGTGVLAALAHNPFNLAQMAWDLHYNSGEKFILGICTQQDAHLDHRLGVGSSSKHARLVSMVQAIREIWSSWQEEREPHFESEHYCIRSCPKAFRPLTKVGSTPPIYLLCAEDRDIEITPLIADGVFVHPMWVSRYLNKFVIPRLAVSAQRFPIISGHVIATGADDNERRAARHKARQRVAGYWKQTSYDIVFERLGCLDAVREFRRMDHTVEGTWQDEVVLNLYSEFVCDAEFESLGRSIHSGVSVHVTGMFPNVMSSLPRLLPPEVVHEIRSRPQAGLPEPAAGVLS
jgi:alkanesulfonate monooxygenase SsuD/methylene tetrahydromethanopterin reductase-like flavin-dependent oxidoreductase (luciferase family)